MLSLDRRMSFEVESNQVAIALADLLARQMDDTYRWLVHDAGTDPYDPTHRTAEAAKSIAVLCRQLTNEIRRYQHCDRVRRAVDDENIPF